MKASLQTSLQNGVLHLVLDSPQTRNAFGLEQAKILTKSLNAKTPAAKKIQLILISGQGRVFCSGGQLQQYAALKTKPQGVKINNDIRLALKKLADYPAPKVAAVSGDCFGGGIELISCCDWIISESHVFFGMWQRRMELSFGWGGYNRLKKRVAPTALQNWLLAGDAKTAFAAKQLGLVDEVVGVGELSARVSSLLANLQHFDLESYKEIKKGLDKNETLVFNNLWWSKQHQQILQKFRR